MSPLSPQLANNLSHDEIMNEIEIRGIDNIPNDALLQLIERVNGLVDESHMEVQDIGNSMDSLQDDYDYLERQHDELVSDLDELSGNFDSIAIEIKEFIDDGDLKLDVIETDSNGVIKAMTLTPVHSNGIMVEGDVSVLCQRSDESLKMKAVFLVKGEEHTTLDGEFENDVDSIHQSIMPSVVHFLYKHLSYLYLKRSGL